MGLLIRMVLYLVAGMFAGYGIGTFDSNAGTFTVNIEALSTVLTGTGAFVGTFVVGRWGARWRGWRT